MVVKIEFKDQLLCFKKSITTVDTKNCYINFFKDVLEFVSKFFSGIFVC